MWGKQLACQVTLRMTTHVCSMYWCEQVENGTETHVSTFKLRCLPRLLLQGLPTAPQSSGGFRAASLAAAPVREASHPQLRFSQRAVRGRHPTDMGSPRPESRPQFAMTLRPLQRQSSLQLPTAPCDLTCNQVTVQSPWLPAAQPCLSHLLRGCVSGVLPSVSSARNLRLSLFPVNSETSPFYVCGLVHSFILCTIKTAK